jgi:serine/threonine protein kinase
MNGELGFKKVSEIFYPKQKYKTKKLLENQIISKKYINKDDEYAVTIKEKQKLKFQSLINQKVLKDKSYSDLIFEINDFFINTVSKSWILGFETSHIFYQKKSMLFSYKKHELYTARQILTNQDLAIQKLPKDEKESRFIKHEINVLEALKNCKYIVPIYEAFQNENNHFLVYENLSNNNLNHFCEQGLFKKIHQKKLFLNVFFFKLCKAIDFIHSCGISHRNLNTNSIFLGNNLDPLIFNFKYSSTVKKSKKEILSKTNFSEFDAPELISNNKLSSTALDVFSCGKILNWMTKQIGCSDFEKNEMEKLSDLINKMTEKETKKRISLKQALKHKWFDYSKTCSNCDFKSSDLIENYSFSDLKNSNSSLDSDHSVKNCSNFKLKVFSFGPEDLESNSPLEDLSPRDFVINKSANFDKVHYNVHNIKKNGLNLACSTHNTNQVNSQNPEGEVEHNISKNEEIKKQLIIEYLEECGFPKSYLSQILSSGSDGVYSHVGACFKTLFKKFN